MSNGIDKNTGFCKKEGSVGAKYPSLLFLLKLKVQPALHVMANVTAIR
jgi:hypothetical protein